MKNEIKREIESKFMFGQRIFKCSNIESKSCVYSAKIERKMIHLNTSKNAIGCYVEK